MAKNSIHNEKLEKRIMIVGCLLLPMTLLLVFTYWPAVRMVQLSFTNWDGMKDSFDYVGFGNFTDLFQDKETMITFKNNFAYFVVMIAQTLLALYFAIALDSRMKGSNIMKTIMFMPYVLNGVAIAFMFSYLYEFAGPLNQLLSLLSGGRWQVSWLDARYFSNFSLAFIGTWRWTGFNMVIFYGGLQSIPVELKEAAYVDGASFMQTVRHIILPNIKRIFELLLFMGLSGVVNAYFEPYVMTKGGPGNTTHTFVTKQLEIAFTYHKFGKACAMGVLIILIVIILRNIQILLLGDSNNEK